MSASITVHESGPVLLPRFTTSAMICQTNKRVFPTPLAARTDDATDGCFGYLTAVTVVMKVLGLKNKYIRI